MTVIVSPVDHLLNCSAQIGEWRNSVCAQSVCRHIAVII